MGKKIRLIANPAAGNWAVAKNRGTLEHHIRAVLGETGIDFTHRPGDATRLAKQAIRDGAETIVAVGGDGTLNETLNGFFENGSLINPDVTLGLIPMGTGGDWVRSIGIPQNIESAAQLIHDQRIRKCDVGLVRCQALDGSPRTHYFLNIADAGFGGELAGRVNRSSKSMGSFFAYLNGLLRTLTGYKNQTVSIEIDDQPYGEQKVNSVVIANGQFFGGGMWIAPEAEVDDGDFEVVIIGDVSRTEVLANLYRIYNGSLAEHPKATNLRGKRIALNTDSDVLIEADGEVPGKLPAIFENLPGVLRFVT